LYDKSDEVIRELLVVADLTKEKNHRYSEWAWKISVLLFIIGWVLGFFGKIYGVPAGAEG
jgi:hypothetical protein